MGLLDTWKRSLLSGVHNCPPVTLQGINDEPTTISIEGVVDNCHHVLHAPGVSASIRSVSAFLDSHVCDILFTSKGALIVYNLAIPKETVRIIADRREDGLFHVRASRCDPGTPEGVVLHCISVGFLTNKTGTSSSPTLCAWTCFSGAHGASPEALSQC